jgi:secreted trypsin-like serine protease
LNLSRNRRLIGWSASISFVCLLGLFLLSRPDGPEVGKPVVGMAALISASALDADIFSAQFCGGVLIAPDTVLTAGHCVRDRNAASVHVVVGADNLCRDRPIDGQRMTVATIELHPGYDERTAVNDLAVLRLETQASDGPRLVAPWQSAMPNATAIGWGQASLGGLPTCRLVQIPLVVHQPSECEQRIPQSSERQFDAETMVCASPARQDGRDTCIGDSGGPLLLGSDLDSAAVIGITSWGFGCGEGIPGVYARADGWFLPTAP